MDSRLTCYSKEVVKCIANTKKCLPPTAKPQKFISVSIEGLSPITLSFEDKSLNNAINILGHALKGIYDTYGKKNYFFEPVISYQPDQMCMLLRVGFCDKKEWKESQRSKKCTK